MTEPHFADTPEGRALDARLRRKAVLAMSDADFAREHGRYLASTAAAAAADREARHRAALARRHNITVTKG